MGKVTLAVRVCPFTEREMRSDPACERVVCVEDEHTVSITNLKVATSGAGDSRLRVRRYHAEFCLDGSCSPDNPNYASQEIVYASLGRQVLETVRGGGGGSACVLAYGQSATGKTHTMLGTPEQPGLVPRLCRDLAGAGQPITVSFLEIYNERVRDLLCEEVLAPIGSGGGGYNSLPRRKGNTLKDLRVRQHPTKGPYVQNLRRVVVYGAEALCSLVWTGAARRRTAATRRNQVSSRSHAVLQLSTGTADLHLADLAGSEKAGSDGSYRGRQKEGANINRSLVALSNVISALVCCGGSGGGGRYVPYRDSALTWLLKDCFTGCAATFIVATVSPSAACYGESASTLRWAARAQQLPAGRGTVTAAAAGAASSGPGLRAQRALSEQLSTLKAALLKHHILFVPETGALVHDPTFWRLKVDDTSTDHKNIETVSNEKMDSNKTSVSDVNRFGSTASSITSTSSDHLDDKHLKVQENVQSPIDDIFGPVLERTVSGHDLKVTAPLRNKRKQYRSHDVLPIITKPKVVTLSNSNSSQVDISGTSTNNESDNIQVISVFEEGEKQNESKTHVPYQLENPRAEIVASVTERLYTKLKKKEESTASKVENVIEKKLMEPLHELKICTNARQRLMEMSQRALRARRRIGIPAYTQTRISVPRMKNKAIEVQRDLEPYCIKYDSEHKYFKNVQTETHSITSRCKDVAVGSAAGSIYCRDAAIATDPIPSYKSRSIMTDELHKSESFTQTQVVPPPRKKKMSAFTKYLSSSDTPGVSQPNEDIINASIINISISQAYPAEAESLSDDSLDACTNNKPKSKNNMPPDLLSNHNSLDQDIKLVPIDAIECHHASVESSKNFYKSEINPSSDSDPRHLKPQSQNLRVCSPLEIHTMRNGVINNFTNNGTIIENCNTSPLEDFFSDNDERESLPRSSGDTKFQSEDLKNMILGRNRDIYPYNIVISPPPPRLERSDSSGKKSVTFVEEVTMYSRKAILVSTGTQTLDDSRWVKDNCHVDSSGDLSNIDIDDIDNTPTQMSNNIPRLEHSCSFNHVNDLFIKRYNSVQCSRPLGARSKSNVNLSNLNCSKAYNPMFRSRSPSDLLPSKTNIFKQFLFNDDTDNVTATPVSSEPYDPSEDDCTQSSPSNNCMADDSYDYLKNFKDKQQFFENGINKYAKGLNYSYSDLDKKILGSCDQLERSIARHEDYIGQLERRRKMCDGHRNRTTRHFPSASPSSSPPPSVYLQKLIQVRRDVVNTAKLNDVESFHSFHGFV